MATPNPTMQAKSGTGISVLNGRGEIARIVKNGLGQITHVYLRDLKNTFSQDDVLLGSTGFSFRIAQPVTTFPNGIFYIDFGVSSVLSA